MGQRETGQCDPLVSGELVPDARLALPLEEPGSGVIRFAPGAELADFVGP